MVVLDYYNGHIDMKARWNHKKHKPDIAKIDGSFSEETAR